MTEQEYLDLLLDKLGGMPGKRTDGAKIIRGFSKYYDEKQQFVKNYNWQHITTAIDSKEDNSIIKAWIKNNVLKVRGIMPFDRVEVRDVLGQEIFSSMKYQKKIMFDLNSLSSQILIVRTFKKGEVHSVKINFIRK